MKQLFSFLFCALTTAQAVWPQPDFASKAQQTMDAYVQTYQTVDDLTKKPVGPALKKAADELRRAHLSAQALLLHVRVLKTIAACEGRLTHHRITRWFRTIKLPSLTMFLHHVTGHSYPPRFNEAARILIERAPVPVQEQPFATGLVRALKKRLPLSLDEQGFLAELYEPWYAGVEEQLKTAPTVVDLELVALLTHQSDHVVDLFKLPATARFVLQVYTTKKDVAVPSKAAQKLLDELGSVAWFRQRVREGKLLQKKAERMLEQGSVR